MSKPTTFLHITQICILHLLELWSQHNDNFTNTKSHTMNKLQYKTISINIHQGIQVLPPHIMSLHKNYTIIDIHLLLKS